MMDFEMAAIGQLNFHFLPFPCSLLMQNLFKAKQYYLKVHIVWLAWVESRHCAESKVEITMRRKKGFS